MAFDKVPHTQLINKLHHYGVRGSRNHWIRGFLTSRTQQVVLEVSVSSTADVHSGVPQRTVLFLTFINDMPEVTTIQTIH